jgi:uncharacterized protein with HEPN domain
MRDDDRIRILHMIDAAQTVEQFLDGKKRGDLDADRLLLFAVLRAIEVIGEAASKVTGETQAAMPSIPWASIIGMRNRLIHGYFDIDANVVWRTASEEIPSLHRTLRQQLP